MLIGLVLIFLGALNLLGGFISSRGLYFLGFCFALVWFWFLFFAGLSVFDFLGVLFFDFLMLFSGFFDFSTIFFLGFCFAFTHQNGYNF